MPLNRPALKQRAKLIIRESRPSIISVAAVYLLLSIIISLLSSRLMGLGISQSEAQAYMNFAAEGNYDAALQYIDRMTPPAGAHAIDLLLTALKGIVEVGFIIFLLNTIRATEPCFGNLMDGFGFFFKIILLNFLSALFIILWSMLFVVPGIVAVCRYSQAVYILADDPTKSPMQCIRESKAMMQGHKMEFFILQLSFFGWVFLALLPTFGYLIQIWTLPYISTTYALYYEHLLNLQQGYNEQFYGY